MGSCKSVQNSSEVELEAPPLQKSVSKNKFSKDKNLEKHLAPEYPLFDHYEPNESRMRTLQEIYTIERRCQITLEEYQSCHSGSYPLSLHQISRLVSQISSAFKMNHFWIWDSWEHKEDARVMDAFNCLRSQAGELEQKLSLIKEAPEDQETKKTALKEGHKEMDGKKCSKLKTTTYLDSCYSTSRRSPQSVSLNLTLTVETLDRLSWNGFSQKIYNDSFANLHAQSVNWWADFCVKPGEELRVDHDNHKGSTFAKKVRKIALPWFKYVTVKTDSKSLKSFQKCMAYFSPCDGVENLKCVALEPRKVGLYLPQIVKTCSRVQSEVTLERFNLNEIQFKKFLMGCRHHEEVSFNHCKFDISRVPDLSTCMKGAVIKKIHFWYCDETNEWRKYPEKLEDLANGIFNLTRRRRFLPAAYLVYLC